MDSTGLSALLTADGWALLEALPPYREDAAMGLGERLRAEGVDPSLVAAAMTQSRLRARGATKFGPFAAGMLFTPDGLEQATRLEVAAHHAQRYAAAGITRVADLGCGIGGDAMALAGLEREVLAVDRDEVTAAIATVNLRHWPEARVRRAQAGEVDLTGRSGPDGVGRGDGLWVDPSRRTPNGRRVLDPHRASPSWAEVMAMAAQVPATGVKLAPGIPRDLADTAPHGAETQWVSLDGDVVEAAVWCGPLARAGVRHTALVLRTSSADAAAAGAAGFATATEVDDAGLRRPLAVTSREEVGAYLYDPDGAVVRSGLVGQVATAVGGRLLDPTIAYVSAESLVRTPLATAFAVEEVLPFSLKALRTRLRDRGVTRVEILKRGSAVDVEQLRRQLRLQANADAGAGAAGEASLVLTRVAGQPVVVIARRVRE